MRTFYLASIAVLSFGTVADDRQFCIPAADGADASCAEHAGADETTRVRSLDWVTRDDLPDGHRARMPPYCQGAYVEPAFPMPLDTDSSREPIVASARSVQYWQRDRAELSGGVEVRQGNVLLTSREATYREADGRVSVAGDVTLRQPGLLVHGDGADVEVATGAAEVRDVEFVLHGAGMRGNARALRVDESGTLTVDRGGFTTCEPGDGSWSITSRSVAIERGATHGVARNAVLRAGSVPVLYTPYIRFPVTDERLSGFLFPDVGYGDEDGVDVGLPYYWNIAPNADATITPRWVSERGAGGEVEVRHLSRSTRTRLGAAYLFDDDLYNGELSRDDFDDLGLTGPFDPADRWLTTAEHAGRFGAFATAVQFTKVSDDDYFRDMGTNLSVTSQIALEQRAALRYGVGNLELQFWAQDFQNLDPFGTDAYRRLPELALRYHGGLVGPLGWSVDASTVQFDRDDVGFTGIDLIDGKRHHVEPRIELPLDWPQGFLRAGFGYRYTQYDLDDVGTGGDHRPDREIWLGKVDAGLFFERDTAWFGTGAVQTLEPRIYYLYQERANQTQLPLFDATELEFTYAQLFRDNRFTGLDRIGDANHLAVGVTTRFLEGATGRERLRASLGQIRYFDDRDVTLRGVPSAADRRSSSALASEVSWSFAGGFSATSNLVWDPHDERWEEIGAHLQYEGRKRGVFNVGYRGRYDDDPRLKQVDISFYWPATRYWSLMSRWNYDVEDRRVLEAFGGVEYNNCCWQARVLARRFLSSANEALAVDPKPDDGIFVQIVFKGLAGIGGRIDALMENGIRGYRPEEF